MNNDSQKSSSAEQVKAESVIFSEIERKIDIVLEKNKNLYFSGTYIQPDFYSENEKIIGEVYAHIGELKPSQRHKIANDILKMLLWEKYTGTVFRKIIAVCDERVKAQLEGKSALAESIRLFDVEIHYVQIAPEMKNEVLTAQRRQKMING